MPPDPNEVSGRYSPERGCHEVTGVEIIAKKKLGRSAELISLLATSETNLFVERSSNVNRTSNCTTYHWVVTDAEESHHLNVCWN